MIGFKQISTVYRQFHVIFFQNVTFHYHELCICQTAGRSVYSVRVFGRGHPQHSIVLLRGLLHLFVRHEHPVPVVRFLLFAAGKFVLRRRRKGEKGKWLVAGIAAEMGIKVDCR